MEVNKYQASEIYLYITNDEYLYNKRLLTDYFNFFVKKIKKGIFNKDQAIKALIYLIEEAIKKHDVEFKNYKIGRTNKSTKQAVAKELLNDLLEYINYNNIKINGIFS